jgi:hypothetical protein
LCPSFKGLFIFGFTNAPVIALKYKKMIMNTIKDVIPSVIGDLAKKKPQETDISLLWHRISGSSKGSRALEMKNGTLTIVVDSSVRKMHLFRKKETLLEELQNKVPAIKNIYFKVGQV